MLSQQVQWSDTNTTGDKYYLLFTFGNFKAAAQRSMNFHLRTFNQSRQNLRTFADHTIEQYHRAVIFPAGKRINADGARQERIIQSGDANHDKLTRQWIVKGRDKLHFHQKVFFLNFFVTRSEERRVGKEC